MVCTSQGSDTFVVGILNGMYQHDIIIRFGHAAHSYHTIIPSYE